MDEGPKVPHQGFGLFQDRQPDDLATNIGQEFAVIHFFGEPDPRKMQHQFRDRGPGFGEIYRWIIFWFHVGFSCWVYFSWKNRNVRASSLRNCFSRRRITAGFSLARRPISQRPWSASSAKASRSCRRQAATMVFCRSNSTTQSGSNWLNNSSVKNALFKSQK